MKERISNMLNQQISRLDNPKFLESIQQIEQGKSEQTERILGNIEQLQMTSQEKCKQWMEKHFSNLKKSDDPFLGIPWMFWDVDIQIQVWTYLNFDVYVFKRIFYLRIIQ